MGRSAGDPQVEPRRISGDCRLQTLSEGLRKSRIVRGFAMEAIEQERFQKHLEQHRQILATLVPGDWSSWLARWLRDCCWRSLAF